MNAGYWSTNIGYWLRMLPWQQILATDLLKRWLLTRTLASDENNGYWRQMLATDGELRLLTMKVGYWWRTCARTVAWELTAIAAANSDDLFLKQPERVTESHFFGEPYHCPLNSLSPMYRSFFTMCQLFYFKNINLRHTQAVSTAKSMCGAAPPFRVRPLPLPPKLLWETLPKPLYQHGPPPPL